MNTLHVWVRLVLLGVALLFGSTAQAITLTFDQLNWIGTTSSTTDSRWGKVNIDFTGYSATQYFNLSVNGVWVVQNMGIDSLYGNGVNQALSTTFDLGSSGDVQSISYSFYIDSTPITIYPALPAANASVADLAYQIGGIDGVDLGSPGAPQAPAGANDAKVDKSAKLPNIEKVINQVQKPNECAPGAISNSLKYLQATGKLGAGVKTDISDLKPVVNWNKNGAPQNWYKLKAEAYKDHVNTTVLGPKEIDDLIKAVNAGKDVELGTTGHAAMIVGVRKFTDGRVELDIFDDNQTDDKMDAMRTVQIINGQVEGNNVVAYVVESVPEPGSLWLLTIGAVALAWSVRRGPLRSPGG